MPLPAGHVARQPANPPVLLDLAVDNDAGVALLLVALDVVGLTSREVVPVLGQGDGSKRAGGETLHNTAVGGAEAAEGESAASIGK